ncbi:MAG: type VI secretion system tip protein VgrG [Candidatus Eisenbacteria bacterium]|nr:type VI secretion system tip protein VgrG [Candidatus Eisenbacteria bacterium]
MAGPGSRNTRRDAPYTQEDRLIAVYTPLPEDTLLLQAFSGEEGVSRPFRFQLDLLSEDPAVAHDRIVGQPITVALRRDDGEPRYFNGVVSRFALTGEDERFTHYRAEMVPWLWLLTRTADCRIFQNMTIPAIIAKIFTDLGFTNHKNMLQGSFEPREYCVQYRETDFTFVSRLMEEYGICYFFTHEKDKHTLILANSTTAHQPCPGQSRARVDYTATGIEQQDVVTGWRAEYELRTGKVALTDYNFETPSTDLAVTETTIAEVGGNAGYEIYDYPGEYEKKPQGQRLAKLRIEEEEASTIVMRGTGLCRAFIPGYRFDLAEHTRQDMNTGYVLTEVRHTASVGESYTTGDDSKETYSNQFTCIPQSVPYRPPRVTRKPAVQGSQTAVVVGKKGEEIWTDKYGRVKVQFHWDREGNYDEKSSCWVRVSQNWAGKRWGAVFLPRVGQEVIVDFLEGDPDQPIITGRVYNAEEMPPYALPAEQTKSTVKSYSSKGGGGFNEIRFEDKKGKEQLFLHAERNQDDRVKNDSLEWIGRDRHLIIKRDHLDAVEGDRHVSVKGDRNEKVDGTVSLKVGMDAQEKVGMKYALDAGMEIHLKAGVNLVIESGTSLTVKVGGNFININPGGIFISGTMVMINSGGAAGSGSGASPQPPKAPQEADTAEPGQQSTLPPPPRPPKPTQYSPAALVMQQAARNGTPFCDI